MKNISLLFGIFLIQFGFNLDIIIIVINEFIFSWHYIIVVGKKLTLITYKQQRNNYVISRSDDDFSEIFTYQ